MQHLLNSEPIEKGLVACDDAVNWLISGPANAPLHARMLKILKEAEKSLGQESEAPDPRMSLGMRMEDLVDDLPLAVDF